MGNNRKGLVIGSDRSGRHRGEIKGGKEAQMGGWRGDCSDEVWKEGVEKPIFHFAIPLTVPRGGGWRRKDRKEKKKRRERLSRLPVNLCD